MVLVTFDVSMSITSSTVIMLKSDLLFPCYILFYMSNSCIKIEIIFVIYSGDII